MVVWSEPVGAWLPELIISAAALVIIGLVVFLIISMYGQSTRKNTLKAIEEDVGELRAANNRAKSLQAMASTLSATLSFERVMEVSLDVCSLALEEMGIPSRSLVGAVFLYDGDDLVPVATRHFVSRDLDKRIVENSGIVAEAVTQAEPAVTNNPKQDPGLLNFIAFQECYTVMAIPLRAGFQIFGAMVLGTEKKTSFTDEHLDLFSSVADQAVIALQNAQLYQRLGAEKQRIIEADEEARKELARDLHDGPTQSIAAIAMRINFIRSIMAKNPRQAFIELKKVEDLAKDTSREIRAMLFALRPLVLETHGLSAAIEMAMNKIRESDGLNLRLVGSEYGDLLNEQAQGVVFYIIEEALGNARKYSKAKMVEVRLWREDDLFVVRIQDDGVGFDVQSVNSNYSSRGSLGMVNMRERAERIDGSLKVESAPGKGTMITLVVPLDKHGNPEYAR
ncbi:MAG: GAF domain-containing sensor histidine kinase [Candidatus Promineifilaceae bacterium]